VKLARQLPIKHMLCIIRVFTDPSELDQDLSDSFLFKPIHGSITVFLRDDQAHCRVDVVPYLLPPICNESVNNVAFSLMRQHAGLPMGAHMPSWASGQFPFLGVHEGTEEFRE